MTSALAVSELYYLAEYAYHHTVVFIFFVHLVADKGNKSALFCIKLNGIEHTLIHNMRIKWSAYVVRNAKLICFSYRGRRILA